MGFISEDAGVFMWWSEDRVGNSTTWKVKKEFASETEKLRFFPYWVWVDSGRETRNEVSR